MLHLRLADYNSTDVKGNHLKKHRIPLKPTSYKYEMALHCYISGKFLCVLSVSRELVESVSSGLFRHCIVEGVHWGLESMAYNMGR
uniref:Uncharacterized protein n=1 Tax=Aegilops tauschii subsp. strangulata TaxID=200361 RepID=A0A453HZW6_AEGTS